MTLDQEATQQSAGESGPRKLRSYLPWGPYLTVAGLIITAIEWTIAILEPMPEAAASIGRAATAVVVLTGIVFTVLHNLENRVVERVRAIAQSPRPADDVINAQLQKTAENVNYLMAAPTVRLHEFRSELDDKLDDLHRKIMAGNTMVANRFVDILQDMVEASSHTAATAALEELKKHLTETILQAHADSFVNLASGVGAVRQLRPKHHPESN